MEGQSNQENHPKMTPFNPGGSKNSAYHSAEDFAAKHGNGNQGTRLPEPFHNYVEYLTEASPYLPNTTADYALGACYAPVGSFPNVHGVNRAESNFFYNDPGKAFCFKAPDASVGTDFRKVGLWGPNSEGHQCEKFAANQLNHHSESPASWRAESTGDKHSASKLDPRVTVAVPGFLPKSRSSSSKQKAMTADRQRRQRIADNLKALHGLLPASSEGCSAYILDDIIDYVKYLQLQIKELSGRRLQGESTAIPFTFREGYGHYINQQIVNEPLEEMMGKLVEENPAAAAQLLESKGLFMLPLSLAEDVHQAMQMFGGFPRQV